MSAVTESYLKVHYELRPAKQVERRMMMDAFQRMNAAGFQLSDYQYTGFGSVYFIDFSLLHKFLGIRRMLSVEHSPKVRNRVYFNKPYDLVEIEIASISDVIPRLSRDRKHILWLDYDDMLNADQLSDLSLSCAQLSPGSILLVTVDAEPPVKNGSPSEWCEHFRQEARDLFNIRWSATDFKESLLVRRNIDILSNAIQQGLAGRAEITFHPIFNFLYADGHRMLTIGGVIGTESDERMLRACHFERVHYTRTNLRYEPFRIEVPHVTRKERLYLDAAMPCADGWTPSEFEMDWPKVQAYRDIYRFFPAYAEMML